MLIRSILTIAVLGSFVFGAAAQAETQRPGTSLTAQIDGLTTAPMPAPRGTFASEGGLGGTR